MEEIEEKIIQIVIDGGQVCALTNMRRIFMQTQFYHNPEGKSGWIEIRSPIFYD